MIEVVPQWSQLHVTREGLDKSISVSQPSGINIDIGKQGPSGPPGPGATTYDHIQFSSNAEWVVNHNLGRLVSVTVLNSGSVEVEAEVLQVSENQTRIYFNLPQTGKALVR